MLGDREAKDLIERNLVQDLSRNGANASTATSVFGPKGFEGISERAIARKLKNSGFTSVLIVSLRAKDKELNYNPGSVYVSPYGGRYGGYYGRYRYAYDNFYTPGYYTTSTEYLLDADLYSLATNQLIYSAQARSYDPNSRKSLAEDFSESIVNELKTQGFFYAGY
ncbi:MAG: hypothetical protein LUE93_03265 [Bacteroides sp.]|nr:hypothetical protein [Bacteroides sp.]